MSMRIGLLCIVVAASAGGCAGPAEVSRRQAPPLPAPSPETYRRLAAEVECRLLENVLPAWFPRTVDAAEGGFRTGFDRQWRPLGGNPKSIVYQARMTWTAATIAMAYPSMAETYRQYALHGVRFLGMRMWDAEHGGFLWQLDEPGRPPARHDAEKHLYGHAFGIYALARASRATGESSARELAIKAFQWWDVRAHDDRNGGYFEALTRDGRIIPADPGRPMDRRNDAIGTPYGHKSMNAHIHMLEALTELYRIWPDAACRRRLEEVLAIIRDRIAVPPGCLNYAFTADWRPLPWHDSFGHDVETAYLLLEAAEAMRAGAGAGEGGRDLEGPADIASPRRPADVANIEYPTLNIEVRRVEKGTGTVSPPAPRLPPGLHAAPQGGPSAPGERETEPVPAFAKTLAVARSLVDHALDYGWDHEHGGFYDEGTAASARTDGPKVWWTQAEGLNALLLMHERFGHQTDRYWRAFVAQWRFIDRCMIDHRHGDWYEATTREGVPLKTDKSTVWKAAYHNTRALVETASRLRRMADRTQASRGRPSPTSGLGTHHLQES